MDITKLSETELKALAFDEEQKIKIAQANLQAIFAQLEENSKKEEPKKKDEAK